MLNRAAFEYLSSVFPELSLDNANLTLDSRQVRSNSVFFAIKGQNVDARDYIDEVISKGGFVICEPRTGLTQNDRLHLVDDLQMFIVRFVQRIIRDLKRNGCKVICVTGSSGKSFTTTSTTKILSEAGYKVFATIGNKNTEYGLLLTLSECPDFLNFLVLELGIGKPGDMDLLGMMTEPDLVLILNIAKAHSGNFGTGEPEALRVLVREKLKLIRYAANNARIVAHSNLTSGIQEQFPQASVEYYGPAMLKSAQLPHASGVITLHDPHAVNFPNLYGDHYLENAAGIMKLLDGIVAPQSILKSIGDLTNMKGRGVLLDGMQYRGKKFQVYDSSYNANPGEQGSMFADLKVMQRFRDQGKQIILVLGEFLEVADPDKSHEEVLNFASTITGNLVLVGRSWKRKARANVNSNNVKWVVKSIHSKLTQNNMIVFVKGSHGTGLCRYLIPALLNTDKRK